MTLGKWAAVVGTVIAVGVLIAGSNGAFKSAPPTCAQGGICIIGDMGPGGGVVFYDAGSIKSWGRYLEAAPDGWAGTGTDPLERWCSSPPSLYSVSGALGQNIGSGASNSKAASATCTPGAALTASQYQGGGKSDWFLPSKGELQELFRNRQVVGSFASCPYWSSTQYSGYGPGADSINFATGNPTDTCRVYYNYKYNEYGVRPIRQF